MLFERLKFVFHMERLNTTMKFSFIVEFEESFFELDK